MGSAPTFNIEFPGMDEEQLEETILPIIETFLNNRDGYTLSRDDDPFIEVPENVNSDKTRYDDIIDINYAEGYSEYIGNEGKGVIIHYGTYYGEGMETLFPKIKLLNDLYIHLKNNVEHPVNFYNTTQTV